MNRAHHVVRRIDGTVWLGWDSDGNLRHFHVANVDSIKERVDTCRDIGSCDQSEVQEVEALCRDGLVARKAFSTPVGVINFAMPV